jgi:hypothetical protein
MHYRDHRTLSLIQDAKPSSLPICPLSTLFSHAPETFFTHIWSRLRVCGVQPGRLNVADTNCATARRSRYETPEYSACDVTAKDAMDQASFLLCIYLGLRRCILLHGCLEESGHAEHHRTG